MTSTFTFTSDEHARRAKRIITQHGTPGQWNGLKFQIKGHSHSPASRFMDRLDAECVPFIFSIKWE
jgi:hypothetical protein